MAVLSLRRNVTRYGAITALAPKFFLAYSAWVWLEIFVQALAITIFVFFWRAVYAQNEVIGGLEMQRTITYMIMAQVVYPLVGNNVMWMLGALMREGAIGIEFLRPIDFQLGRYSIAFGDMLTATIIALPLLLFGVIFFGLQLPTDPLVWVAFFMALWLGHAVLFLLNWCFACLVFYTTEVWGLGVLLWSIERFFGGALIPLVMLPAWLQGIALALPYAQVLFAPVAILSGVRPLADVPAILIGQIAWIIGLLLLSRTLFRFASRKVTVQGG
jgi:ABC-2 type transport system permease protein